VSNAERRDSATSPLKIAAARTINLHWLLTGQGSSALRADTSLLQEKLNFALADALRVARGPLWQRAHRHACTGDARRRHLPSRHRRD
jgi:hypothetical protein